MPTLLSEKKSISRNFFILISAIKKVFLKNQIYANILLREKMTMSIANVFMVNPLIF